MFVPTVTAQSDKLVHTGAGKPVNESSSVSVNRLMAITSEFAWGLVGAW